ncbi:MAG TPA: imidazole glycerol phosphate synthase subunit HisH [Pyrinomonadaceae bacterium]
MIAIIDYGVGNLRSLEKAFAASSVDVRVSSHTSVLQEAHALVLPGVGAFRACMKALVERGFDELILNRVADGTPLMGVCVGMQMLFEESEEFGKTRGLGLLPGVVSRFSEGLVVPQVGWNQVDQRGSHPLFSGINNNTHFYFVHSYYCKPKDDATVIGLTDYAGPYASVVAQKNLYGVQFHPEKSQAAGLRLLANFVAQA